MFSSTLSNNHFFHFFEEKFSSHLYRRKKIIDVTRIFKNLFTWKGASICLCMIAYIPSESMEATLQVNNLVVSNHLAYQFSDSKRGDIIIFPAPFEDDTYIKRIIGLSDETVSFKDGYVYIDETRLEEDYVKEKWSTKDVENI